MGTNYYLYQKPECEACGRPYKPLHIGKSSGGWCFSLHVIPEQGINTLDDWRALWSQPGAYIVNEYGDRLTFPEMDLVICARFGKEGREWTDESFGPFYDCEADFHSKNSSCRGPHGLVRHSIDGRHCVGHGEGPWDYIMGDFS